LKKEKVNEAIDDFCATAPLGLIVILGYIQKRLDALESLMLAFVHVEHVHKEIHNEKN
jgi:hypothetical protein